MRLTELEEREISKYSKLFDFDNYIQNKTFLITGAKGILGSGIMKWLLYENKINGTNVHVIASTRNRNDVPQYIDQEDSIEFCMFGQEREACAGGWTISSMPLLLPVIKFFVPNL